MKCQYNFSEEPNCKTNHLAFISLCCMAILVQHCNPWNPQCHLMKCLLSSSFDSWIKWGNILWKLWIFCEYWVYLRRPLPEWRGEWYLTNSQLRTAEKLDKIQKEKEMDKQKERETGKTWGVKTLNRLCVHLLLLL